jgi:hypothetical protein
VNRDAFSLACSSWRCTRDAERWRTGALLTTDGMSKPLLSVTGDHDERTAVVNSGFPRSGLWLVMAGKLRWALSRY